MSRNQKYAKKAERFVISNPTDPASPRQINQCNWLLRSRQHGVEFGNQAVEILAGTPRRAECDAIIKHLSKQPSVKHAPKARKATPKAEPVCQTNTDAVIAQMAREGKLGKVAQRKAVAVAS